MRKFIPFLSPIVISTAFISGFAFAADQTAVKAATKTGAGSTGSHAAPAAAASTKSTATAPVPEEDSALDTVSETKTPAEEQPAPAPKKTQAAETPSESSSESKSSERAFRLGPAVAVAIPHPLNVGLECKLYNWAGFAFDYGFLPSITISNVSVKMNSWDVRARLFPFQGAFFLGVAYGKQDLTGTRSENILGTAQTTTMKISTTTLTPHIGWRWGSRFVWGFDLGVQLAPSHKNTLTTTASAGQQSDPAYTSAVNDLNKVADDIGSATLPFITALHFGFMF